MTVDKLGSVFLASLISFSAACFIAAASLRFLDAKIRRAVSAP